MNNPAPTRLALSDLADRYDALLIDAYGVLVDGSGPLPGAAAALTDLEARGKRWLVLTNDASRHPDNSVKKYQSYGFPLRVEQIVTSGSLLMGHFAARGLVGFDTVVFGPEDSHRYAREAGGRIVEPGADAAAVVGAAAP